MSVSVSEGSTLKANWVEDHSRDQPADPYARLALSLLVARSDLAVYSVDQNV